MSFKALVYAYVLGGITFIPALLLAVLFITFYTSVPVANSDVRPLPPPREKSGTSGNEHTDAAAHDVPDVDNDLPKPRKGWLTVRRTFEEEPFDGSYVNLMRSFLDARSKDPKRSRPRDLWHVVLKGKVLYLYEDESMTECEAVIELGGHSVTIYPEGLLDGELFAKRNAICLRPKGASAPAALPNLSKEMKMDNSSIEALRQTAAENPKKKETVAEIEKRREATHARAMDVNTPWFLFVRSTVEMEDWYLSLVHASTEVANTPILSPLDPVYSSSDMAHLVGTLDEQPDIIPMRWLNALLGRLFFSLYRTDVLETYIIGRIMKKLSKVKRPSFLSDVVVTEVSVGNTAPVFSKPMLKELAREGDASVEVRLLYKGEVRITAEATATINLGQRFKSYTVKLVLAVVLRELEGNLLVKVKRPPSNRIWYAFTQPPRMVLDVEPVVSDRQIKWSMILNQIEARLKEIIQESVVMPNMDDIAFFQSADYEHRGGIWADAKRQDRTSAAAQDLANAAAEESIDVVPDDLTPASTPELHSSSLPNPEDERRSSTLSVPPNIVVDLPVSPSPSPSTSTTTLNRRSIGASSIANEDSELLGGTIGRGRPSDAQELRTRRSTSVPIDTDRDPENSKSNAVGNPNSDEPRSAGPFTQGYPRSRSLSSTSDFNSPASPSAAGSGPSYLSLTRRGTSSSTQTNSTTSSFLSTLKSRAGDKQALSNSAKEAMRKWGMNVNWGSLRRDNGTQGSGSGSDAGSEELADGESTYSDKSKTSSYAHIKAGVAERRERRPHASQYESDNATPTPNETIVEPGREPAPTTGKLISIHSSPSPLSMANIPSTSSGSSDSAAVVSHAGGIAPALDDEPVVATKATQPIHVQPTSARSMTVPGIHARHRGEVMSLGYTPPQPDEPRNNKTPGIQSVYRLWKAPTPPASNDPMLVVGSDTNWESTPVPLMVPPPTVLMPINSNPSTSTPQPTPPPLPPRSSSASAGIPKLHSGSVTPEPSTSPASAALISIVAQTQSRRSSVEGLTPPNIPDKACSEAEQRDGSELKREILQSNTVPVRTSWKPPLPPRKPPADVFS